MRKILTATLASIGLVLLGTITAHAADPVTVTSQIVDSPDNDCPAWARDTFTRTTTLTDDDDDGTYDVSLDSTGTFVATSGITGTLTEVIEYQVTGTLLDAETLAGLDGETVDMSGVDCKANSPEGDKTSQFALRYFEPGATAAPISLWEYVYDTGCESFTENASSEAVGADTFSGIGCPGQDGQDGDDGADGNDGQDGADGADGQDGQDGADGEDGQDADDDTDPVAVPTEIPAGEQLPKTGVSPVLTLGLGLGLTGAGAGALALRYKLRTRPARFRA